jgi:hypothetical protein
MESTSLNNHEAAQWIAPNCMLFSRHALPQTCRVVFLDEPVIRSTGAGLFIAPAGHVISMRRSVYYGADSFISDRPVD